MRAIDDIHRLKAFVTVARHGSVSKASPLLHLSQPAVSLQLKSLGEQMGLKLFDRRPHGLELTSEGGALLVHAERLLRSLGEFNLAASVLQETVRGTLRLGTILDPAFTRLGAFLSRLLETTPHAEIELQQAMSGRVLECIREGSLDGGFYLVAPQLPGARALEDEFAIRRLITFDYLAAGPPGWGPRLQALDWHGLAGQPWLATPVESVHHRLLATVFGPDSLTGIEPRRVALVDQESSMFDLVTSGVGLSLMRDSIAIAGRQSHGLEIVPNARLECTLAFVCLRNRRETPVIEAAWSALGSVWSG